MRQIYTKKGKYLMIESDTNNTIRYACVKQINNNILDKKMLNEYLIYCNSAIKILETELTLISDEFDILGVYNPIDHIKCRVKTIDSIIAKAEKKGLAINFDSIEQNITDIVGVRIVCPFLSDVYDVVRILKMNKKFNILQEQDYISTPKSCGYSSYHILVEVPVNLSKGYRAIKAEIQVRTLGMDFWATLEHKLNYKMTNKFSTDISANLYNNAKKIFEIDEDMDSMARILLKNIDQVI